MRKYSMFYRQNETFINNDYPNWQIVALIKIAL